MKILSVANEKGGVGKTVLALNQAWELSRNNHFVLVIDLDQQIDLTKILYRKNESPSYDIFDVLTGQCHVSEACIEVKENLYIIPGSKNMKFFKEKDSEFFLKEILMDDSLSDVDVIIIDTPPSTSEISLLGYVAASDILIVTDSETFSTQNIGNFIDDIAEIKTTMNPNLTVLGVVANKIDMRRSLTKRSLAELRQVFGELLLESYVSYNIAIPTSLRNGQAVRELGWSGPALSQLKRVSEEIQERLGLKNGNG